MDKECAPCNRSKNRNRTQQYIVARYVLKDPQGNVIQTFGNKAQAAVELSKHAGYTLHEVIPSSKLPSKKNKSK